MGSSEVACVCPTSGARRLFVAVAVRASKSIYTDLLCFAAMASMAGAVGVPVESAAGILLPGPSVACGRSSIHQRAAGRSDGRDGRMRDRARPPRPRRSRVLGHGSGGRGLQGVRPDRKRFTVDGDDRVELWS